MQMAFLHRILLQKVVQLNYKNKGSVINCVVDIDFSFSDAFGINDLDCKDIKIEHSNDKSIIVYMKMNIDNSYCCFYNDDMEDNIFNPLQQNNPIYYNSESK